MARRRINRAGANVGGGLASRVVTDLREKKVNKLHAVEGGHDGALPTDRVCYGFPNVCVDGDLHLIAIQLIETNDQCSNMKHGAALRAMT